MSGSKLNTERRKHGWWSDVYNASFKMMDVKSYKRGLTGETETLQKASHMSASLCPECNRIWEPDHVSNPRKLLIHYHDEFPTFKIPRNTCVQCKEGGTHGTREED